MRKLVECVPNFSEGHREEVILAIAREVEIVKGVSLLDVDPDKDYNRTVVTFVGEPDGVVTAAFKATQKAAELIDMREHKGEHPRIGATDVVPFVPVSNVSMEECVQLAHQYGKRIGEELKIPVYLYEEAATLPERRNLAKVRKGEYEGLQEKLNDPSWNPDYGPSTFNPRSGATITGARVFLIAYNVNLDKYDKNIAQEIATRIRESGKPLRDKEGKIQKDEKGKTLRIPGSLKSVKANGFLLEAHEIAQVSINLTNYEITPPHVAFEEVKKEAETLNVNVTGSEIVGLIPMEALLMAGRFIAEKESSEEVLIQKAVSYLGLSQLNEFKPEEKIIEYCIKDH
jgi:glutamate formiminotransferase/formiminotetrahydrofolate cyclodeaminase